MEILEVALKFFPIIQFLKLRQGFQPNLENLEKWQYPWKTWENSVICNENHRKMVWNLGKGHDSDFLSWDWHNAEPSKFLKRLKIEVLCRAILEKMNFCSIMALWGVAYFNSKNLEVFLKIMKILGNLLEKSWNYVSPDKWEPCLGCILISSYFATGRNYFRCLLPHTWMFTKCSKRPHEGVVAYIGILF